MSARTRAAEVDLRIDEGQCIGCAICADVCAFGAMEMGREDVLPRWEADLCTACLLCERECPTEAIEIR